MSNDIGFRIVCTKCGCLSIRIEEPLRAVREAVIYCGDCGTSRGTIGALRDLAVQRYPDVVFSMISTASPPKGAAADEPQAVGKMSKRYAELRRLRQQVEIAEWLARKSNRPAVGRVSKRNARRSAFRPMHHPEAVIRIDDERGQKLPH
jgi:hypothetical protein